METDPYARIVEWYDIEHNAVTEDVECYAALIAALASGRAHVLEIGSGTGRTAAALATAGCRVTGIEPSVAMRAACMRRLAELPEQIARRITIVEGTATEPSLADDARFDVVLYGLNTFAHLTTEWERQRALAAARRHLTPTGQLIVDLDVHGARRLRRAPGCLWWQGTWPLPDGGEVTHCVAALEDERPDLLRVQHFYDITDSRGSLRRITVSMTLAVLRRQRMERLLAQAGFALDALYGGYDLAPYEQGMPRAIFVALPA